MYKPKTIKLSYLINIHSNKILAIKIINFSNILKRFKSYLWMTGLVQIEDSLLYGLKKDALITLESKKKKTFEEKIVLVNTFIELFEYNKARTLLKLIKQRIRKNPNSKVNDLILCFLENKLHLIKAKYSNIVKYLDLYSISEYNSLDPREKTFLILILFVKAEAFFRLGEYYESQELAESILKTAITTNTKNEKSTLSEEVIKGLFFRIVGMNSYYLGDIEKFSEFVYKGLDIYSKTDNSIYLAYFYNFHGIVSAQKGDYYKALESYQKCINFFKSLGTSNDEYSIKYIAKVNNNIASILSDQGRLLEAIDITLGVIQIYEQTNTLNEVATCYNSLGVYYLELKDFKLAEIYLYKGFQIRKLYKNPVEISESLLHICLLEEKTNKLNGNSICIKKFPKNYNSKVVLANKLIIEGVISFSQKDYLKSLECFDAALEFDSIDFSLKLVIIDFKAEIFLENDDFKQFKDLIVIWKMLAKDNNLIPSLFKAYLIDFRFELLFLNFELAQESIQEAFNLAQNYSKGALKLVEQNIDLLNKRKSLLHLEPVNVEEEIKKKELDEIKIYIKQISSIISVNAIE
jgi:tetratricopeptide (TPR) repeat protein